MLRAGMPQGGHTSQAVFTTLLGKRGRCGGGVTEHQMRGGKGQVKEVMRKSHHLGGGERGADAGGERQKTKK